MPDGATSNAKEVEDWLDECADAIRFTSAGADKSLGEDLCDGISEGIVDRTIGNQQALDGSPLKPLSEKTPQGKPSYGPWKRKHHPGKPISVLSGQMMSGTEVKGRRDIGDDEATITHGVDEEAIKKGGWFTEQGRPFWGLDDTIVANLMDRARAWIKGVFSGG